MLSGVTALVTGGSRGIGLACARRLALRGARVVIASRDQQAAQAAASYLPLVASPATSSTPPHHLGMRCDVRDYEEVQRLFREIEAAVNDPEQEEASQRHPLGIVVNSAGVNFDGLLLRTKPTQIDQMLDTNLKGTIHVCREAARPLLRANFGVVSSSARSEPSAGSDEEFADSLPRGPGGSIVNIGSIIGSIGNTGQAVYSASKAGLQGLTRSLAKELGPRGIRVNLVEPGFIAAAGMTDELSEEQRQRYECLSSCLPWLLRIQKCANLCLADLELCRMCAMLVLQIHSSDCASTIWYTRRRSKDCGLPGGGCMACAATRPGKMIFFSSKSHIHVCSFWWYALHPSLLRSQANPDESGFVTGQLFRVDGGM